MDEYQIDAGRLILKNGQKFCTLTGCKEEGTGRLLYDPVELDQFARDIVTVFNLLNDIVAASDANDGESLLNCVQDIREIVS